MSLGGARRRSYRWSRKDGRDRKQKGLLRRPNGNEKQRRNGKKRESNGSIVGEISEETAKQAIEVTEDDINTVSEQTGITDKEKIREALLKANGDIAEAIIALKG